jgi:hypothetical protein
MFKSLAMRGWRALIAASAFLLAETSGSAAIIQTDFATPGDNLLALDTDTGLEWLRVTATINISYNTLVSTHLAPGGIYEGFAHATLAQVTTLFTNAGIDVIGGNDPSNFDGIGVINSRLGYTEYNHPYSVGTRGVFDHSTSAGSHSAAYVQQGQQPMGPAFNFAYAPLPGTGELDTSAFPWFGHWLVRAPAVEEVPEPGTLVLLATAMGSVFALRRRRARNQATSA